MPPAPTVPLPHGATMPQLGLGTWPMSSAEAERALPTAIEAGYRLVDTAYAYGNEDGVGAGLRASGLPREELFVTTKLNAEWHGVREVREAFVDSTRQARRRVPRPVPHPLAQPRPGPLRRRLARALPPARRGARPRDRRLELQARPPRAAPRVDRGRARRQPDRAQPLSRPHGAARVPRAARDRDAVLQPDRQGRRAAARARRRRCGRAPRAHARRRSCCAGTCSRG